MEPKSKPVLSRRAMSYRFQRPDNVGCRHAVTLRGGGLKLSACNSPDWRAGLWSHSSRIQPDDCWARLSCPRATEQAARACSEPMVAPYGDVVNCSLTKIPCAFERIGHYSAISAFWRTAQVSADAGRRMQHRLCSENSLGDCGRLSCGRGRAIHAPSCPATAGFPPCGTKDHSSIFPSEAAKFIGIHEGYLRQLVAEGKGPPAQPIIVGPIRSRT